jgi:hypothetical protein
MNNAIETLMGRIVAACDEYEKSAPTVRDWLNDLYVRIHENTDTVVLSELLVADRLWVDDDWMQANHAANLVFHMLTKLGRDTTGQAGF